MASVPATEFKAKCLELMDRVAERRGDLRHHQEGQAGGQARPRGARAEGQHLWLAPRPGRNRRRHHGPRSAAGGMGNAQGVGRAERPRAPAARTARPTERLRGEGGGDPARHARPRDAGPRSRSDCPEEQPGRSRRRKPETASRSHPSRFGSWRCSSMAATSPSWLHRELPEGGLPAPRADRARHLSRDRRADGAVAIRLSGRSGGSDHRRHRSGPRAPSHHQGPADAGELPAANGLVASGRGELDRAHEERPERAASMRRSGTSHITATST